MGNSSKTFGKLTIPLLVLLAICFWASPAQAKYSGGTGEPNDPFRIAIAEDLNDIGNHPNDWSKHFEMIADINLGGFTGTQFNIIGGSSPYFSGLFDGNDHQITRFTYVDKTRVKAGIFGRTTESSEIRNVHLVDVNLCGHYDVGGLVGVKYSTEGIIGCFWDVNTSGQTASAGGTGLLTAQMQQRITFTDAGWDFTTLVWTIDEGVDYPRLWWETPVLHAEPEVTLGTSNTITWDPVPGANDYYAECAADANFTNILHNSGWITEISYEFTGLQLGRRYWYSVKARNIAGTESNWSNVESSLQLTLADAVDILLDPRSLRNRNMKNALLNKINAVQQMIDDGLYADALNKLRHDILAKMDGCALIGEPDRNDWIKTCEAQSRIRPFILETIEYVRDLTGQSPDWLRSATPSLSGNRRMTVPSNRR
ncbi:hypothetical protein ES703_45957 [subsurface metagenome]